MIKNHPLTTFHMSRVSAFMLSLENRIIITYTTKQSLGKISILDGVPSTSNSSNRQMSKLIEKYQNGSVRKKQIKLTDNHQRKD